MAQISYGTITITDITDIESIKNWYLATSSSSGVTKNTSGWTDTIQQMDASKQYLWNYEQILGTDNIEISSTNPVIIGHFGINGQNGADGNSITSIDEYYKITNSTSNPGSSGWTKNSLVVPTNENRYLWNYQVINYSKTSAEGSYTDARIIGVYGDTGQRGSSILKVTTAPTSTSGTAGGFSYSYRMSLSTVKTQSGKSEVLIGDIVEYNSNHYSVGYVNSSYVYLSAATSIKGADGQTYYTHILYSSKASPTSSSDVSSSPTGKSYVGIQTTTSSTAPAWNDSGWIWMKYIGTDGSQGPQGVSVTGVKEIYYLKTSSGSVPTTPADGTDITSTSTSTGVWTTAVPDYVAGAQYYTSIQTSLSSGTSPIYSPARVNQGLTAANQKALDAYNTSIARDTEVNALKAQAKHYWWDSQGAHVAAGENTTSVDNITQGTPSTYGFNSLMAPGYLALKYKDINFAQLATNSLTFYRPATNGSTYVQGKKAMTLDADALTFYKPLAYNSANEPDAAATLNANGLILAEGGIVAGTKGQTGYIYLSTANHPVGTDGITINGFTPTASTEQWREVIGTKFGVTNAGTLYASNAVIDGNIAATNGFTVTSNGVTLASMTGSGIVLGNEADSNAYNIKINNNGILLRKYSTILNKIDTSGMHIYDNNSIAITEITDNLIKFGKNGSNQFLINSDGFKLYTVNGEEQGLGAVEFSVGATSSTNIIMYEGIFPFYTTGTNTNITINSPWTANTDGIYTLTSVMPSSIVVTFDVKSNTPGTYSTTYSYTGTLTRSGSTSNYTGTASSGSQPTFALSYNLDDGILRIVSRSNNTNLIGQVVDNSMFEGYSFFNTNTINYGGNSSGTKNTTITLTKTPISGTNFNVQFDWMENPENFVVGTQKTISFTRDTIYDENTLYLLNGEITYNGSTSFTFKINPVMIQDIETETETALATTYSTDIGISISDFHTHGLCYSDANIKIYGTGKPASYTFGTRRGTVNQIGANSFTVGMGVIASTGNQVVVGTYNKENSGIFVVGNGSATAPSNALTIYKNGLVSFGDKTKNVVELNAITANYNETFLRIHDSGTDYGHITVFKSDGNMIIGAGESPTYAYVRNLNNAASGTTENLFLTADSHIYLYTNAGTSETINSSAKKFGFYNTGWADVPKGINFVGDVGTTKKPTIYTYNNKTPGNSSYTNYGCLGFRAAGKKKPYFAFWTSENGGDDIGRLYINTKEVYTDNGTNFSVDGYTYLKGTSFNGLITANSGSYTSNTITFNWVSGAGTSLRNGSSPSWGYKWGPVCFVTAYIKTTGTIAAGANVYEGSINQTAFYPRMTTYGLGYIGTRSLVASLKSDGTFLLRNASSTSIPTDTELWFSFCYLS